DLNEADVAGVELAFSAPNQQHAHFPRLILGIPGKNKTGAYGGAIFMKISLASFVKDLHYDFIVSGTGKILHRFKPNHPQADIKSHSHNTSSATHETFPDLLKINSSKSHLIFPSENGQKIAFVKIVTDPHQSHTLWLAHTMDMGELETWLKHFHQRFGIILAVLILLILVLAMIFAGKLGQLHRELVVGLHRLIRKKEPLALNWSWPAEIKLLSQDMATLSQNFIDSDQKLHQNENFLKSILDGIQDGISVHDQNFTILETNKCIENWYADKLPLVGKKCYEIFHNRQTPCEACPSQEAMRQNILQRNEMLWPMADGSERWLEIFAYPVHNSTEEEFRVVEFFRDITVKKQAETQRDTLLGQLAFSQKMEAVGTLAGGVAHDFNNILSAINGYAELCIKQMKDDNPLLDKVKIILESGQRAARLTQQLLAFSRKQIVTPQDIDIDQSLQGINKMLARVLGEDIDINIMNDTSLWHIYADQTQFEQVIVNLAVNARDAMPHGGKLTFEAKNIILDQAYTERHYQIKAGQYVLLTISDSGQGMDKETLSKIFEPFFTTKEEGKGTGLGLATVYGIIKQNNGEILVYSEPGQGTCFKIYMPRHEGISAPKTAATEEHDLAMGTETILFVEDDEVVRTMTVEILTSRGYLVLEAANGEEALLTCKRYHGHIDLLLTDVVMPKMSGAELAKKVAKLRPDIPVVFMSGYTDNAVIKHGILQDDVHFLQKPVTPLLLTQTLRTIFDKNTL
nr:ATP-binding protein [Spirochaetales bacterium]